MTRIHSLIFALLILGPALGLHGQTLILKDPITGAPSTGPLANIPLNSKSRLQLDRALKAKNYKNAEALLIRHIRQNPRSPRLLVLLGNISFLGGNNLNSAIAFKKAEVLGPLEEPARFMLALDYVILKRNDWARQEFGKLVEVSPENALYHYWLSKVEYDDNKFTASLKHAQKAIELDSTFERAYDTLGLCYEARGEHEKAVTSYKEAVRLNREKKTPSPWPPQNLGALLVKLNQLDQAEDYILESLRYAPDFPRAHYQMGRLWEKRKNYPAALEELKLAVKNDPSFPDPHYTLGRIQWEVGEKEAAEASWKKFEDLKKTARKQKSRVIPLSGDVAVPFPLENPSPVDSTTSQP